MEAKVIKKRIGRVLVYTLLGITALLAAAFLLLQLPSVQHYLLSRYFGKLNKETGFTFSVQSAHIQWFDRVHLTDLNVFDPVGNEMIHAGDLRINFKLSTLLDHRNINIDGVVIDSARVFLTPIDTSSYLNIDSLVDQLNTLFSSDDTTSSGGGRINIGEALLRHSEFRYSQPGRDSIPGFDYNHFHVLIDDAQLQRFYVQGDTIAFNVGSLEARDEKTGLDISSLSTNFLISQKGMAFTDLDLHAGKSVIGDSIVFHYNSELDLDDFVNNVTVVAHLQKTRIEPSDLALFAPDASKIGKPVFVSGEMKGRVNDFRFNDMEISIGSTVLKGSLAMDGLPNLYETFIELNLHHSKLNVRDFDFVIQEDPSHRFDPLGTIALDGQFLGYPTDFVAAGTFNTDLGTVVSDINFKVDEADFNESSYSGNLKMIDFDAGQFIGDTTLFQKVNLNGRLKGRGLTVASANFVFDGHVTSAGINGYNYRNITTDGKFSSEFFEGKFAIDDPNLQFNAQGSIDLRNNLNLIKIVATVDTANVQALGLIPDPLLIKTKLNFDLHGFSLDSLTGRADVNDLSVRYKEEALSIDHAELTAVKDGHERALSLNTSFFDASAKGNFLFSNLFTDLSRLANEFYMNLLNDKARLESYYAEARPAPGNYTASFRIDIKNIRPISKLLQLDLYAGSGTEIEGQFISGYTTRINAFTNIDTLSFGNDMLLQSEIEISASKISDSSNVLAMAYVYSPNQIIGNNIKTKNLVTEAIWNKNHIDFTLNADQSDVNNSLRLVGSAEIRDSTYISFKNSSIQLLNNTWNIDKQNVISNRGLAWVFKNLRLTNDGQSIIVHGSVSEDPSSKLTLEVHNFDLSELNSLLAEPLAGQLNANVALRDYYHNLTLENKIEIKDFYANNFLVGNVSGENSWSNEQQKFLIDFHIDRNNIRIVSVKGDFDPAKKTNPLSVSAVLESAELRIIEPLFDGVFSHMDGKVNGRFHVGGSPTAPVITGSADISDSQLTVDYLQTVYQFTGTVQMTENSIMFQNFLIHDSFKNTATLNGTLTHRNFRDSQLHLESDFSNFQLLNTTTRDNSLFYGQGYGSGHLDISGPIENLAITATARTDRNTRIYIPIGNSNSNSKKDYINFVSFNDTTFNSQMDTLASRLTDLSGIVLNLNLDVTPDAYCEIIFDIRAGDIIRGRGNGNLKLQIDTKGEFNMFGPIEFTEGWYNFTIPDIINKEFQIQPGGRITWYGDPYGATLNVTAAYNQMASLAPIINDPDLASAPAIQRRYPVQVLLKLNGPMLSPDIGFDIVANDLPSSVYVEGKGSIPLDLRFQAFKNNLDEQELNRQVFSLVVLRRFSPPESFNTSGTLFNSVSELLSNQLSYWLTQVDDNLEIDVDLGTMDDQAFNTFQLRFSYSLLGGRLRITRDGTLAGQANTNGSTGDFSAIAGDWTVDYLLTPDGKFKVKMYNRTNANPLQSGLSNPYYTTAGVSLQHTQSFDRIRDIWRSARKRETSTPVDDPSSQSPNQDASKEDEPIN